MTSLRSSHHDESRHWVSGRQEPRDAEKLKDEYMALLTRYLEGGGDQEIHFAAHELGRKYLEHGFLPEEVEGFHLECIDALAVRGASHDEISLSRVILVEVLMVFSVAYRELMIELDEARKALEEKNIRLQALSDFKTRMISIVAHDVRGPLSAIREYIGLFEQPGSTRKERKKTIAFLKDEILKIETLAHAFLEHNRIESGSVRLQSVRADLDAAIRRSFSACVGRGSHSVIMEGSFPAVMADSDRLVQIFQNLMGNALKFSPHGGKITIAGRMSDREAVVSISDEGIGIPEEDLQRIFLPFHRSARSEEVGIPGTGLGLSIVKLLVEQQGGKIWAESKGKGSTFCVTFPLAPGESAAPAS